jgi:NitT/TauT family transport system ATP-binding protein
MAYTVVDSVADAPIIEVLNVDKTYKTSRGPVEALRDATCSVRAGEFVALVGPSGCGKSTLLHIMGGLVPHESGSVTVNGSPARAGRRDTAVMLQKAILFPWRTVLQNTLLPAEVLRLDRVQSRARALELLETVGLQGFEDKYPWELSGGMRQRVSLVQTLVADPAIILMDEPFSAVDEFTRERLNCEVAELHDRLGRTSVYVTHNIHEAVFLSNRVIVMKPSPGQVAGIVEVDLPRPRTLDLLDDERMTHAASQVRKVLSDAGGER